MSRRARIRAYGSAGLLTVAGVVCGVCISGLTGQLLIIALVSFGLGGAVLLMFYEVGLSEDHERAREQERNRQREGQRASPRSKPRSHKPRWQRRPN